MTEELELGSLSLYSATSCLNVQLRSTAKFAPSGKDDIDQLQLQLTAYKLSRDRSELPFILHGGKIEFVIRVRLDESIEEQARAAAFESLSSQLRHMKLWSELELITTAVRIHQDAPDLIWFILSLEHSNPTTKQSRRQLHRLGEQVSFADTRPPSGVCSTTLACVEIDIEAGFIPGKQSLADADDPTTSYLELIYEAHIVSEVDDVLEDRFLALHAGSQHEIETQANSTYDVPFSSDTVLYTQSEQQSNFTDGLSPPLMLLDESDSEMPAFKSEHSVGSPRDLLKLIESALAAAIVHEPQRRHGDSLLVDETFLSLWTVAPAVFKAGHFAAIAERSVFMPTISHAIASVCCKNVIANHHGAERSNCARQRFLDRICNAPTSTNSDEDDKRRLRHSLQARLWKLLERQANLPKRRIPRRCPNTPVDTELNGVFSNEILEPAEPQCASYFGFDEDAAEMSFEEQDRTGWSEDDLLDDYNLEAASGCDVQQERSYQQSRTSESSSSTDTQQTVDTTCTPPACSSTRSCDTLFAYTTCDTFTTMADEMDMQSICSSVEMLSLPDTGDGERSHYYEDEFSVETNTMLSI